MIAVVTALLTVPLQIQEYVPARMLCLQAKYHVSINGYYSLYMFVICQHVPKDSRCMSLFYYWLCTVTKDVLLLSYGIMRIYVLVWHCYVVNIDVMIAGACSWNGEAGQETERRDRVVEHSYLVFGRSRIKSRPEDRLSWGFPCVFSIPSKCRENILN
jgi:hypothetical protein